MHIERIQPRFTVKTADIIAARREGVKCWVDGNRVLFSRVKPKGNWYLMSIAAQTEPEAA